MSVVIPAHDEESRLPRCLAGLEPLVGPLALDVVVVANGCTDRTAEVARAHPWVTVVEHPVGSKVEALNAGDAAARGAARVYLDADVRVDAEGLTDVVRLVSGTDPLVCAPRVAYDLTGCSWPVRAHYRVQALVPATRDGVVGHGLYAVSAAGRRRFDRFPDLHADDLFVSSRFGVDERVRAAGEVRVWPPRDLASLVRVRTRVARGNASAAPAAGTGAAGPGRTTRQTIASLAGLLVRRPLLLADLTVFGAVAVTARLRARAVRGSGGWATDTTARQGS
ncbi:glycosyltransferase family 2 protein [Arthrobacter sp. NEB 688]|uniref:glycosyltransferase n=1 Tax=Arthrobacter sp. NEB 688 TaxID=904039 RepID=UPI0015662EF2|nr:glycosyltransferase family 2 protein [Arthrobacter sp. NEB 688]QKE85309.1 glycosyltransferase family 2 protein [Arthrobacter sp. NEB 688]